MCNSRNVSGRNQESSLNEEQWDVKSTQTDHDMRLTYDAINILDEQMQTDAIQIKNLEQEAAQKDQ